MFNLFSKKEQKEYLSCNWLESGINFDFATIKICCMCVHEGKGPPYVIPYNGQDFDYEKFFARKERIKNTNKSGEIYKYCKGCINLTKAKWEEKKQIKYINIDNQTACNSNCVYCYSSENKNYFNSKKAYKILPTIKKLLRKKILVPGGEVMFGGGEPTINEEFEELVNLFLDKDFNYIKVHSSGIKYSSAIERCLKEDKADIIISPDAGSNELYQKIKRVDSFEAVWDNLKKYAQAQSNNRLQVKAKYVIIPSINDSEQEIDNFLSKVIESEVNSVRFDIEANWYDKNRSNQSSIENIFKLLKYAKEKATSMEIQQFFFQTQAQTAIKENEKLFETAI